MTVTGGAPRRVAVPLLAGAAGGVLLTLLQVPAGTLVGAVLGSAIASPRNVTPHRVHTGVRTVGLVLLGCVSAARLDQESLQAMLRILLPVLAGVLALLVLNVLLARWLVRRHRIDPTTAVLACAPGGFSELSVMAVREGADVGTVAVVHMVRVLVVVLVAVPVLVAILSRLT